MRLKKKEAYIKAVENLEKRSNLVDKASEKYKLAVERLNKAQEALSDEQLAEVQAMFPKQDEADTFRINVNDLVAAENIGL